MKAWDNAMFCRKAKRLGMSETLIHCVSELIRKHLYYYVDCKVSNLSRHKRFMDYLVKKDGISYFDFNGAKLPDVTKDENVCKLLEGISEDTFLVSCNLNDNYEKSLVERLDKIMNEGPYGYKDGKFDVTVKKGDIVFDGGAWIGDFSAYAASKGATCYAFEPTKETCEKWLKQTAELNGGRVIPVNKGLGDKVETQSLSIMSDVSAGNAFTVPGEHFEKKNFDKTEQVEITSIDAFVKEHNLPRVDFIKADIEGFERNMLMGARETLKKFAPKLALCTYHRTDDPAVMYHLIKEANPAYTVVFLSHKLYAAVVD